MRRLTFMLTLSLLAACAPREFQPQRPAAYRTAASCLTSNHDNLHTTGQYAVRYLTVATGNPAVGPWWEGGTTDEHSEWKLNDPYLGKGFEGAVTFEVAERLGFAADRITFVPVGFEESLAPGPKGFDFALRQIPSSPERTHGVDFSEAYYDVSQALVSVPGSPLVGATSLGELRDATLGAPTGTSSFAYIEDAIRPSTQPVAADDLRTAVRDLRNGRIDGLVVDLPSASSITETRIPEGVIVGRLPSAGSQEHFAMALEKGSPLVECIDLALREMKDDGTLDEIRREWLAGPAGAPLIDR